VTGEFSQVSLGQPPHHAQHGPPLAPALRRVSHRDVHMLSPIAELIPGKTRCSSAGAVHVKTSSPKADVAINEDVPGSRNKAVFDVGSHSSSSSGSDVGSSPPGVALGRGLLASTPVRTE
jgi:hypothetical protein